MIEKKSGRDGIVRDQQHGIWFRTATAQVIDGETFRGR